MPLRPFVMALGPPVVRARQGIFSVKRFAFHTIRQSFHGKNAVIPLGFGRAALCRASHVAFF